MSLFYLDASVKVGVKDMCLVANRDPYHFDTREKVWSVISKQHDTSIQ